MTGKTYLLRCRLPAGQCTIDHLTDVDTVSDLKATLFSLTDIHPNRLLVMAGVPPMKLNLDADDQPLSQLIDHQRETLIVSENKGAMCNMILNSYFHFHTSYSFFLFECNDWAYFFSYPQRTRHEVLTLKESKAAALFPPNIFLSPYVGLQILPTTNQLVFYCEKWFLPTIPVCLLPCIFACQTEILIHQSEKECAKW